MTALRSKLVLSVVAAGTLLGAAGLLGYALRPVAPPESLKPAATESQAPVNRESFGDDRKVQVRLKTSDPAILSLRREGVLTKSECTAGGSFLSGQVVASVDEQPIIGLHTAVPLFRDLNWQDSGTDVTALQQELVSLGYLASEHVTGWYGWNTSNAVQRLRVDKGAQEGTSTTLQSEFLWLPANEVSALTCEIQPGQNVSSDTPLAKTGGAVAQLEVVAMPGSLTPGARSLTLNGLTGPVSESGVANDPTFLARVSSDVQLVEALRKDSGSTVTATLSLADKIEAHTVPVGAIVDTEGLLCVRSGARTLPVALLGSALGTAVISFTDPQAQVPQTVAVGLSLKGATCAP
ncbi:peptidoglycan-binding protein [Leucobacter chromiireducens]|uniref:peptidoglycan-binding protein n=1 Tax=Leucobacter chromiireducens TaxID=283877 RepID=UPI0019269AF1